MTNEEHEVPLAIDHIVVAGPDLPAAIEYVTTALGVEPAPGGQHVGRGTRNALVRLGDGCYLEVIGPDPDQGAPASPRAFGIDEFAPGQPPILVGVAVRAAASVFDRRVDALASSGQGINVVPLRRARPDGVMLSWRVAHPEPALVPGLVVFMIDWMDSPHPSESLVQPTVLQRLRIEHPDPPRAARSCAAVGLACEVAAAPTPRLVATIATPSGVVEL